MANEPLVSVIIPAFNAGGTIDEALGSVLDQDYPVLEVIVIDDGSTDDTVERVAAYAGKVRCPAKSNSGGYPGVPRNAGMSYARGDYICFLDADDVMCPGRIRLQVELLSGHPEVGIVFSDYRNFSAVGCSAASHFETCGTLWRRLGNQADTVITSSEATTLLLQANFGIPSAMMIRRKVLNNVPGFSRELQTSEDFHFYYRVAREFDIGIVREVGALRRLHTSNVTNDSLRVLRNYIASRIDLRLSETKGSNIKLLNEFLCKCEIDIARELANRCEFVNSLAHSLRSLTGFKSASRAHLGLALRTMVRTAAIAAGLKSPSP